MRELQHTAIEDENLLVGSLIDDRYEVRSVIGCGSYGTVYEAQQITVGREVAVKVLHRCDATRRERFRREAEALSKISHPNVVTLHDFGMLWTGQPYMVMDIVYGENLGDHLERIGRIPPEAAIKISIAICNGLAAAHKAEVVHRDLKPTNIVLARDANGDQTVKLIDFGLAKPTSGDLDSCLTGTGETIGTPQYMSPEQCKGQTLDPRSDIYSLGCIMYEMLTGKMYVNGDSIFDCMHKQVTGAPPEFPEDLHIPDDLQAVITKALSKDAATRYQNASDIAAALHTVRFDKHLFGVRNRGMRLLRFGWKTFWVSIGSALALSFAPTVYDLLNPAPFSLNLATLKWKTAQSGSISFQVPTDAKLSYWANFDKATEIGEMVQRYAFDRLANHYIEVKHYPGVSLESVVKTGLKRHSTIKGFKQVAPIFTKGIGKKHIPAIEQGFYYNDGKGFQRHVYFEVNKTVYKIKEFGEPPDKVLDEVFRKLLLSIETTN